METTTATLASPETFITLACQWCHTAYGKKPGFGVSGLSHGICTLCCSDCGSQVKVSGPDQLCPKCGGAK